MSQLTCTFTPPASTGTTPITGYTVTLTPSNLSFTGTSSPIICTGLPAGIAQTATVVATNSVGSSVASAVSNAATPASSVTAPGAPVAVVATAGNALANLTITPPVSTGGAVITDYVITSTPATSTQHFGSNTVGVFTGLTNAVSYTFTAAATNSAGTGPGTTSNAVTPTATATAPGAPTGVTASATSGAATVTFTAPSNGGSAITGYTATSSPGGVTGTSTGTSISIGSLTNGTAYTFTVTATNAIGTGPASSPSSAVTPSTVPGAPTIGAVTAGNAQVSVAFTAPISNGGAAISGYQVTVSPGGFTATGATTPIVVTGLGNGTAYTATVKAQNLNGYGTASGSSSSFTPSTVPGVPTIGTIVAGNGQVSVPFTIPASDGGSAIDVYVATLSNGQNGSRTTSPITVTSPNGTAVTAQVRAHNANGYGANSPSSNSVTPTSAGGTSLVVITPNQMPGYVGRAYFGALMTIGGIPPYTYAATSSQITCSSSGILGGSPTGSGSYALTGTVTDSVGNTGTVAVQITILTTTGTLAISTASLPNATAGGAYFAQLVGTGGKLPYVWTLTSQTNANEFRLDADAYGGMLAGAPVTTGARTLGITLTDASGATATASLTCTVDAVLHQYGLDYLSSTQPLPPCMSGSKYKHIMQVAGGTSPYTWSVTVGSLPTGLTLSSAGMITGTPTVTGVSTLTIRVTDNVSATHDFVYTISSLAAQTEARPTGNTGSGFYISASGRYYDPGGKQFQWRGTNANHYDENNVGNIPSGQANAVRCFYGSNGAFGQTPAVIAANAAAYVTAKLHPIMCVNTAPNGNLTTNNTSVADLGSVANWWATTIKGNILTAANASYAINIANEWGPSSTVWRDAYAAISGTITGINTGSGVITYTGTTFNATALSLGYVYIKGAGGITDGSYPVTASGTNTVTVSGLSGTFTSGGTVWSGAIGIIRAAGYTCPLQIDAPGDGQDKVGGVSPPGTVFSYGTFVEQSDPQQNTMISVHLYGGYSNVEAPISAITKATNGVLTFSYPAAFQGGVGAGNPFQNAINFTGYNNGPYLVAGVAGMTQINGLTALSTSNSSGSGPYTVTLAINTSAFSTYTSGGFIYGTNDIRIALSSLAGMQAQGTMIVIGESGPATPPQTQAGSQTWMTDRQMVELCEACGIPWLDWAWDDGTGGSDNSLGGDYAIAGFNHTGSKAYYAGPTNLTYSGLGRVLHPTHGFVRWSQPASTYL